jgi:flagellar basal-body rod modification protein FlgD
MITATKNIASAMYSTTPTAEPPQGPAEPTQGRSTPIPTNAKGMGQDEFLKMLVAQLKNQDPLNPMDGKDMAAQLAQFSTVEQLIAMNKSLEAQQSSSEDVKTAIEALTTAQNERADELAQLIEGQMAMSTVGKIGVTTGNTTWVDKAGSGQVVIDTGTKAGVGRLTMVNEKGEDVASATIDDVAAGQQAFDLADHFNPPLPAGKYTYRFEVATDGGPFQAVKTYTAGRITGLRYANGNPILIIGDSLSIPMAQLTQIRG